jgi:hypothetical protein
MDLFLLLKKKEKPSPNLKINKIKSPFSAFSYFNISYLMFKFLRYFIFIAEILKDGVF